ncbi:hypothetical protein D3C75_1130850 [compost metagenome]
MQYNHQQNCNQQNHNLVGVNLQTQDLKLLLGDDLREALGLRPQNEDAAILQKEGNAHCRDQDGNPRCIPQRTVCNALNYHAEKRTEGH